MPPRLARTARSSSRSSKRGEPAPSPNGAVVAVGEIVGAHALRGWLRVRAYQPPAPSLVPGRRVLIEHAGACRELEVVSATPHGRGLVLLTLAGVDDRRAAEALVGARVLVRPADLPPPAEDEVLLHQLRDYASGRHLQVDGTPYGGGPGMLMRPEPLVAAIEHVAAAERPRRILLSPRGVPFSDERARALACEGALLLICPRYEGVDERVIAYVDEELSIGDYVLTGGEMAALVVMDAVVRLLPGAVGNQASPSQDSHTGGLLEHPQYTRPEEFRGARVPEVLLRGDHAAIARWRREESLRAPPRSARACAARRRGPRLPPPARVARWLTSTWRSSITPSTTRTAPW